MYWNKNEGRGEVIGTIIVGLDGITQGVYDGTRVGKIEWSTDGTENDNHDSVMLIWWCVSVDVHFFRTNWDTEI